MRRRNFLKLGALGAGAAALAGCQTLATPRPTTTTTPKVDSGLPELEWHMATSWPLSLDTIYGGAQAIAQRVAVMSNNKFRITPHPAGELGPANQVLDMVSASTVAIGHTASYYYVAKTPAVAFGTTVPFGLNAQQQNAWLYDGGGLDLLQKLYAEKFKVIQFPAGNTGAQMGGWFRKPISTLADLQGLKMRIPGLGGQVMTKLGVTVETIPASELVNALQSDIIDAAEWVGPYDDEKLGLHQAATLYYYPGWWEPGPALELEINLTEWNRLPLEYQEILKMAAYEANLLIPARYDSRNNEALRRLVKGGTQLRAYGAEILTAAEQASFALFDELAQTDADFKGIYANWRVFRENILAWHQLNEGSFFRYFAAPEETAP